MTSAFFEGARKIELRGVPEPTVPDDGLLMQVAACGVCGSDVRRWKEGPPDGVTDIVPGHEAAGTVIAVGKRVKGYSVGDQLAIAPDIHCGRCYYCERALYNLCDDLRFLGITSGYPGAFAEQMVLTHDALTRGVVHHVPDGMSLTDAALSEPCSSVLATHQQLGTSLRDTVVVIGAGPTGCIHVAVAKAQGARVIVSQRSETRRRLVAQFEPDLVVDPTSENLVSRVLEFTRGVGADSVICANPVADTQTNAVEMVRKGGTVVLFGGLPKANPMTTLDGNKIHYGEVRVIGAFSYHPTMHALALDAIQRGLIPAQKLITHTLPLAQVNEGFEIAASGQGLKVIVTP